MPKLINSTPKYRKHRASGQAIVTIDGRDIYLGPHGTKTSHSEYDRIVAEWLANGRRMPVRGEDHAGLVVAEVMAAYLRHAKTYYRRQPSGYHEMFRVKDALKPLRTLYGRTPASEFGPMKLKAVRQTMLDHDYSRTHINMQIGRIKRMFKWSVSEELVPASVFHALSTVEGLRRGRTTARESKPVLPVDEKTIESTIAFLPATVADMVRVQRLTGCRPGELCQLRPFDLDRSNDVWAYRPATHKNEYRGRDRVIFVGPKAQDILRPYLLRPDWEYCFVPAESERLRRQLATEARTTPLSCGNRAGTNRKTHPKRSAGECYTNNSYRRAIQRAVEKANEERAAWNDEHPDQKLPPLEKWAPNRLRHAAATEIRRQFGLEACQTVLGQARADVTQVYAERDYQLAREVARQIG